MFYHILFIQNNNIYYADFHREYRFHGNDDEEYYIYIIIIYLNDVYQMN